MTLASYFTLIRIFISPLFLLLYLYHDDVGVSSHLLPFLLIILFGISELSDAIDGYIARKYNQVTDLGKILDPMADSISRFSYFLTFTASPVSLPLAIVVVFFYRDAIVSTLRTICGLRGFALAARTSGKIKAGIQALVTLTILLLMIFHSLGYISTSLLHSVSTWIVAVAAIYTVYSAYDYIYANRRYLSQLLHISHE